MSDSRRNQIVKSRYESEPVIPFEYPSFCDTLKAERKIWYPSMDNSGGEMGGLEMGMGPFGYDEWKLNINRRRERPSNTDICSNHTYDNRGTRG